jgi:nucleotide-binding universal stress UspA family protein
LLVATVVVGVDGSLHSVVAAHWAAAEAARRGAELLLLAGCHHLGRAPEPGESYAETEARARVMLASVALDEADRFPEVQVRYEAVAELPVAALLAAQKEADLLVVGSRGLGGFRGLLLGSVSRAVAGEASGPVVVVRPERLVTDHLNAGVSSDEQPPVVVGVDTSDGDSAVLEFALKAAEERGTALHAVAVAPWPPSWRPSPHLSEARRAELAAREEEALAQALTPVQPGAGVGIVKLVSVGHPAAVLVEEAQNAALIVLGRRKTARPVGLGATAHAVLHHALAPVAVVPHS